MPMGGRQLVAEQQQMEQRRFPRTHRRRPTPTCVISLMSSFSSLHTHTRTHTHCIPVFIHFAATSVMWFLELVGNSVFFVKCDQNYWWNRLTKSVNLMRILHTLTHVHTHVSHATALKGRSQICDNWNIATNSQKWAEAESRVHTPDMQLACFYPVCIAACICCDA